MRLATFLGLLKEYAWRILFLNKIEVVYYHMIYVRFVRMKEWKGIDQFEGHDILDPVETGVTNPSCDGVTTRKDISKKVCSITSQ